MTTHDRFRVLEHIATQGRCLSDQLGVAAGVGAVHMNSLIRQHMPKLDFAVTKIVAVDIAGSPGHLIISAISGRGNPAKFLLQMTRHGDVSLALGGGFDGN